MSRQHWQLLPGPGCCQHCPTFVPLLRVPGLPVPTQTLPGQLPGLQHLLVRLQGVLGSGLLMSSPGYKTVGPPLLLKLGPLGPTGSSSPGRTRASAIYPGPPRSSLPQILSRVPSRRIQGTQQKGVGQTVRELWPRWRDRAGTLLACCRGSCLCGKGPQIKPRASSFTPEGKHGPTRDMWQTPGPGGSCFW